MTVLTDRELEILRFERLRWRTVDVKAQVVADVFALRYTRYLQVLGALVRRPEAVAAEPQVVARLRRLAAAKRGSVPPVVDPRQRSRHRLLPPGTGGH